MENARQAGANRIDGVHFELRDQDGAFAEALQQAVAKARAQASAAASAAGQQLGQPVTMHVGTMMPYPQPMYRSAVMDMAAPAAPTPIQGGVLEIGASVTITYELIGG